ncbi:MAG TPA: hypothetical protein VMD59_15780 [Acidimicrobiales bacterium]|nr:hypothetical protein [Acidimicrobiales bacterium]
MRVLHGLRRRQESSQGERTLIRETEAFLSGRFAEHFAGKRQLVPAWAALNPVAHADLGRLQALAATSPDPRRPGPGTAAHILAREVLDVVEDDEALLAAVQRFVLRPLELRLIEESSRIRMSEYDVVTSTRSVLRALHEPPQGRCCGA